VLGLAGIKDADAKAARIFELEKRMATAHSTRVESIDVVKANNHWSRKDFDTRAPGLDWQEYFRPRASADRATSSSGNPRPSRACRRWLRVSHSKPGRNT
jgi:predicted metalloendopeptidase